MIRKTLPILFIIWAVALSFPSFGQAFIQKRKHLPGYHIDLGSRKDRVEKIAPEQTTDDEPTNAFLEEPLVIKQLSESPSLVYAEPGPQEDNRVANRPTQPFKQANQTLPPVKFIRRAGAGAILKLTLGKKAVQDPGKPDQGFNWASAGLYLFMGASAFILIGVYAQLLLPVVMASFFALIGIVFGAISLKRSNSKIGKEALWLNILLLLFLIGALIYAATTLDVGGGIGADLNFF